MIDCKDEFEDEFDEGRLSEYWLDDGSQYCPPRRSAEVVSDFKFRSPAQRALIRDYVLTQLGHRPDGLPKDQTSVAGGTETGGRGIGKSGRRRHDVLATSETTFGPTPPRVSERILHRYRAAVNGLWRMVVAGDDGAARYRPVGPLEIVDLLLRRVPEMRNSTFNTARAAVLYWLDGMTEHMDTMQARIILLTGCPKDGFRGPKPGTTSTRYSTKSTRARTFSRRDFDRLLKYLDTRAAASSNPLGAGSLVAAWLRAGLATGLRPVEWVSATWTDGTQSRLWVKTAKQRRGEADWTAGLVRLEIESRSVAADEVQASERYREVSVDEDDRADVDAFIAKIQALLDGGEEFPAIYSRAKQYLWLSSNKVFGETGPRFTLYQMRGQFGANRKARQGVAATAEEMGNSMSKASTYYGKAIYAHKTARLGGNKPADRESGSNRERGKSREV